MNDAPDVNTKDALLAAAMEVFADKGFDAATVRDICGKANANVAAVNYHYGGKDALYVAVLEEVFPQEENDRFVPDANLSPEEQLRAYLLALISEIYERGDDLITQRWAIFLREIAKPSHNLDFIVRRQVQTRADELRAIVSDIMGPGTPDHVLAFASSSIWALAMDHVTTQPILDRLSPPRPRVQDHLELFVDHVLKFSLGGLKAIKE
ncbi:TetR/AcrR family transcriptional regulator [Pseudodesulfovibrio sp. zrk46]|uniref:TetR/AcrR family transcriptional regulator n=1 Tax=Pseudodesulfovibrio sp. zrk46 TaxID=2725288 RepID=UPI001449CBA3|nr:TetR/AcrR family transcriptional regulator [Pseudodesulfovibrio sp. zrk46]QJB55254.1 TetR/AcrR family transcriptional regulator [Pseudodesulfovibrio sp. zrk46]